MCGVDENPFANKSFILKLMRMASSHLVDLTAGRFDWKTMGNTVAECLDFAKHDPQTERVWKPITASVYWNLQSLFSGQPVDLKPKGSALHGLVDIDAASLKWTSPYGKSLLISSAKISSASSMANRWIYSLLAA